MKETTFSSVVTLEALWIEKNCNLSRNLPLSKRIPEFSILIGAKSVGAACPFTSSKLRIFRQNSKLSNHKLFKIIESQLLGKLLRACKLDVSLICISCKFCDVLAKLISLFFSQKKNSWKWKKNIFLTQLQWHPPGHYSPQNRFPYFFSVLCFFF